MHCPTCLYCGARLIQRIKALTHRPAEERSERCSKVLADWLAHGHSETELRRLAKAQSVPLQPLPEKKGR